MRGPADEGLRASVARRPRRGFSRSMGMARGPASFLEACKEFHKILSTAIAPSAQLVIIEDMHDMQPLPDDLTACQAIIVEQAKAVVEQNAEIAKLKQLLAEHELTINELLQRAY